MVGVGGRGKQSLSRLASSMMYMTTFQVVISWTYSININDLKTDLQTLYQKAGIQEDDMLFLFTEGQITNEKFLVYINDLPASGEIAELYTSDEKKKSLTQFEGRLNLKAKLIQEHAESKEKWSPQEQIEIWDRSH